MGRHRGTHCTSVDAAFLFKTPTGVTELALVEWKFTESYLSPQERGTASDTSRIARYNDDFCSPDGPIRSNVLPIELLLDEPFYQLMRQQLLAYRLEEARAHGADVVRVLHVLASENSGYQDSLARDEHRLIGATVDEVWATILRASDRFVHVNPAVFLDPQITCEDYVDRYSL